MKKIFYLPFLLLCGCAGSPFVENLPMLQGRTMSQIRSEFGKPAVVHLEENASLWTYNKDQCACLIFFDKAKVVQHAELRGQCSGDEIL